MSRARELWEQRQQNIQGKSSPGKLYEPSTETIPVKSGSRARELWEQRQKEKDGSGNRFQPLFDRYNKLLQAAGGMDNYYKTYRSQQERDSYRAGFQDVESLRQEINAQMEELDGLPRDMGGNLLDSLSSIEKALSSYDDYYGQWNSKDEYDRHVDLSKKYKGKDPGEVSKLLSSMADGEEKDWLAANKNQVYRSVSDFGQYSKYLPGGDELYEYINGRDNGSRDAINREYRLAHYGTGSKSGYQQSNLDHLNDEEISIYNYFYGKYGKESADEYLASIEKELEGRSNDEIIEKSSQLAKEHPVLASAVSVGSSLASSVEYAGKAIEYATKKLRGEDATMDTSNLSLATNAVRGTVSDDFLYSTAMSGADSLSSGLMFGNAGGAVLGLSAAAQGTNDALERGMSDGQAFWNGIFSGVFEGLFETLSIGNFNKLKEVAPDSVKTVFKNIGKSMLVNASEESLTEIANIGYDTLINGEFANYTWEELRAGAWKDALFQVLESGASGALMGFGMSGVGNAIGYFNGERQEMAKADTETVSPEPKITGVAAAVETPVFEESVPTVFKNETVQDPVTLGSLSQKYGKQAKDFERAYMDGQDVAEFDRNFQMAYAMGQSGVKRETAMQDGSVAYLSETQKGIAYDLGAMAAERTRKASGNSYYAGFTGRSLEDVETYGENIEEMAKAWEQGAKDAKASLQKGKTTAFVNQAEQAGIADTLDARNLKQADPKAWEATDKLAKEMGMKILVTDIPDHLNGSIADGVVKVNAKALKEENQVATLRRILAHETTHRLKEAAPEAYAAYRDYCLNLEAARRDGDLDSLMGAYREKYAGVMELDKEGAMDEVAADYTQYFLDNTEAFQKFVAEGKEHRSWGRKLIDGLKKVFGMMKQTNGLPTEIQEALKLWEKAYNDTKKAVKNAPGNRDVGTGKAAASTAGSENLIAGSRSGLTEWEVTAAVYEALDHKRGRYEQLIKLGNMPKVLADIIGSEAELYVRGNHLYENTVDKGTAERDGRLRKGAHYHNLGEETVIDAIMALENPAMLINDPVKENPTMVAVLPVSHNDGAIYAALSFYSPDRLNSDFTQRPHIVLTVAPIPAENTSGRKGLSDLIRNAVQTENIIYLDKKMTAALPVNAQNVNLGIVTVASVKNNLAQFQEKVNQFKEKNRIYYSVSGTETILEESRRKRLREAAEKYGTIPPGEKPAREVTLPKQTAPGKRASMTIRTVLEAGITPEELVPRLTDEVLKGTFSDEVHTNAQTVKAAEDWAQNFTNTQDTYTKFTADVRSGGYVSEETIAQGYVVYNQLAEAAAKAESKEQQELLITQAVQVLTDITNMTRTSARMVQATRILKKMSPECQYISLERAVENLNDRIAKENAGLKLEDGRERLEINRELALQWMMYLNAGDQTGARAAEEAMYKDLASQVKRTWVDRWNAWRYLSMLGNAKTLVRNLVGNVTMAPMKYTKNKIAAALEMTFVQDKSERTKYLGLTLNEKGKNLRQYAREDYVQISDQFHSTDKYTEYSNAKLMQAIRTYKNQFQAPVLKQYQQAVDWVMNGNVLGDTAFMRKHYENSFTSIAMAKGWTAEQIQSGRIKQAELDKARALAYKEAQKATFRDLNGFSEFVSHFRFRIKSDDTPTEIQWKKAGNVVAEGILPFRQTPANVLVRAVEYSPVELLWNATMGTYHLAKGNMTATEYIDRFASGLTGTGWFALGMFLSGMGMLAGGDGDEDERRKGIQDYSLNIFGKSYSLDWLTPAAIPMFMGAACYDCIAEPILEGKKFELGPLLTAIGKSFQPILEMSCLSSVNSLLDSLTYAQGADVVQMGFAFFVAPFISYLGQGIPTWLAQTASLLESQGEKTYMGDIEDQFIRNLAYDLVKLAEKLPFADWRQVPRMDAWGRTAEDNGWFEIYLSPGYANDIRVTEADQEIDRLKTVFQKQIDAIEEKWKAADTNERFALRKEITQLTELMNVSPQNADTKISNVRLTQEEYIRYAQVKGENNWELFNGVMESGWYEDLSDVDKSKVIRLAYDLADARGKYAAVGLEEEDWRGDYLEGETPEAVTGIKAHFDEQKLDAAVKEGNAMLKEAIRSGQSASAAFKKLRSIGKSDKEIQSTANKETKALYMDGQIGAVTAKNYYKKYGGMTGSEAVLRVNQHNFAKEYPELADLSEEAVGKYNEYCKPAGVDAQTYYDIKKFAGSAEADKDANGNSINGSQKEKILNHIHSQNLTVAQKDSVYDSFGYSAKELHEAPWHR